MSDNLKTGSDILSSIKNDIEKSKTLCDQAGTNLELLHANAFKARNVSIQLDIVSTNLSIEASRRKDDNTLHILSGEMGKLSSDTRNVSEANSKLINDLIKSLKQQHDILTNVQNRLYDQLSAKDK